MRHHSDFYKKIIQLNEPCYLIAEAGINHNGDIETALKLIDVACEAGANAVKFQTFKPENLVSMDAPMAAYQKENTETNTTQYEMLVKSQLKYENHAQLQEYCINKDIDFLSTPFEEDSADFLETLDVPAFKVPSGEITNLPYLEHLGSKGKPIILSTGMSNLAEIEAAICRLEKSGSKEIVILHCVSQYPAPPQDTNLRALETIKQAFGYPVGFSDHSIGSEIALAAVSLGARVIEKHFTLSKSMSGPDHKASLEPEELRSMIKSIRTIEKAFGDGRKRRMPCEENTAEVARKSIFAKKQIFAGQKITTDDLSIKRPGTGIPANLIEFVLGKRAVVDISKDMFIDFSHLN